ncbi:cupin domain-containing protein [Streptomyces sp. S.PB5]|uniref:cupin domain-containing protein n=1 Tax=Streptomyces sp. S.PB5 TaxID=3020844 RepID=UPI0025AF4AD1|nr:cupin domain-containing protein [Streptomyces sp. S.PB5]MDN3029356.1 cupin domain-containing protein [Streptomyces sp. S.PB5]
MGPTEHRRTWRPGSSATQGCGQEDDAAAHGPRGSAASIPCLAQREDQQRVEWIGGSVISVLLDAEATGGQLAVGRFDISKGEAPPFHVHNNEDEVLLLQSGSALVWTDEEEHELQEGGIVFLPRHTPHGYRITSDKADLLLISTPREAGDDVPPRGP